MWEPPFLYALRSIRFKVFLVTEPKPYYSHYQHEKHRRCDANVCAILLIDLHQEDISTTKENHIFTTENK